MLWTIEYTRNESAPNLKTEEVNLFKKHKKPFIKCLPLWFSNWYRFIPSLPWMLTIVMKTKTSTVAANQRVFACVKECGKVPEKQ